MVNQYLVTKITNVDLFPNDPRRDFIMQKSKVEENIYQGETREIFPEFEIAHIQAHGLNITGTQRITLYLHT